jgi:TP901 family phage tail tape measure protein
MASELGHMSAEIGLNIQPFLSNQAVLRTQIRRTGQLLKTMESASKLNGGAGQGNIYRAQIAQLRMYGQQVKNFRDQYVKAQQDIAKSNTVDHQRGLASSATQLQTAAMKYDNLRLEAARTYQAMKAQNSWWGQQAAKIGDYGDKLQGVAQKIRGFGSGIASAAIGGAFLNATKSAIAFKSQIQAIGPLLSNDGRITATVSAQLRTMSADSLKWSQQYGISTRSINSAMTELVRRGFTAQQTLGSMPAILNASRASGESLTTVMQATASAIEMFGLKANTTAGQVKNTQRVTDVLTVAANKTAASFADISAAMMYVGPTAAQAHMSIEQVAAAIGALSNRGIEASTAGTTLRQVLSKLTTDTATNRAHMKAIGVDIDQIKKKGVDLPKLIDQINTKLKDKTPTEKMALLNQAFGKLGQGVMALFQKTNKSSKSAGSELRALEQELYKAGGTTARIAKQMNNTPEAKWQRFKQTIHATGVTIGSELLPMFTRAMNIVKDLAKRFDELSPSEKRAVTDMLLFVAAIKPLSSIVAAPIAGLGKLMNVAKGFMNFGARISGGSLTSALREVDAAAGQTGGLTRYSNALRIIGPHSQKAAQQTSSLGGKFLDTSSKALGTGSNIKNLASGFIKTGAGAEAAAGGAGTFGAALSGLLANLPLVVGGLMAAGGAFLAWQNFIKPGIRSMKEHQRETALWGTTVGKYASESGEKFKKFSDKANDSMRAATQGIKGSTKDVKAAFKGMSDAAESASKKRSNSYRKIASEIGGTAGAYLNELRNKYAEHDRKYLANIRKDEQQAQQIIKASASNGKHMTADTKTALSNLQSDVTDNFLKIAAGSKKSAAAMRAAINGTFTSGWTMKGLRQTQTSLKNAMMDNQNVVSANLGKIKKFYMDGNMTTAEYLRVRHKIIKDGNDKDVELAEGYIRAGRKQKKSYADIKQELNQLGKAYGLSSSEINKAIANVKKGNKGLNSTIASTKGLTGNAKKATEAWNKMVFNPKTGKIKTNAKEALADMTKTDAGWKKIKFIVKNAKMTVKGKELLSSAIIQAGKWNSLTFKEKRALVVTKQNGKLMDTMNQMHQWNNLDPKVQQLIVKSKNPQELFAALHHVQEWNSLTVAQKKLILTGSGFNRGQALDLALTGVQKWNNLTPQEKTAVANYAKKNGGFEAALKHYGLWNKLPNSTKKIIQAEDNASEVFDAVDRKAAKKTKKKVSIEPEITGYGTAKGGKSLGSWFSNLFKGWNKKSTRGYGVQASVSVSANTGNAKSKLDSVNNSVKKIKGKHTAHVSVQTSGTSKAKEAANAVKSFSRTKSSTKHNRISTTGAESAKKGASAQRELNAVPHANKHNTISTTGTSGVRSATSAQRKFKNLSSSHKRNSMHTTGTSGVRSASAAQRAFLGLGGHHITNTIETVHLTTYKKRHAATGTRGAWNFKHFAYGTPNTGFEGGPVVVGDGGRKEVVYEPRSRMLFTTPATDTLMDLEKDSVIWRSVEAFEQAMRFAGIKNYPKFGDGTASASMVNVAAELPDNLEISTNSQTEKQTVKAAKETRDLQMQNNELIALLVQQSQQMMQFMSRVGFSISVDGKEFAQATAQENSKAISRYIKQSGMRFT